MRRALAAQVSRARKPPKTNANSCDFHRQFANFPRAPHRTFKILLQIDSRTCTTTASDDHTSLAVDARMFCAKIAPNRPQNRAIFNRNRRSSVPKMRANKPKSHPNAALMLHIIFSTHQAPLRAQRTRSARVACSKTSKNQREVVRFSSTILQIFRAHRTAHSKFCS